MRPCHILTVSLLFLVSGSAACSLFQRTPQPTGPFFTLDDPQDAEQIQTLRREADQLLMTCSATGSCDRAHHLRGLTALYEDRAGAADEFQAAVAMAPTHERAESSRFWLHLLKETTNGTAFRHATARLLAELLARDSLLQQLTKQGQESEKEAQQLQKELHQLQKEAQQLRKERETTLVQSLQRELKVRDKKIEDLTAQLEALKEIEREMRRISPPAPSLEKSPPPAKKGTP